MEEEQLKLVKDYPEMFSKDSLVSIKAKDESERFLLEYELECRRGEELDDHIKAAKKDLFETKRFLKDTLGWKPSGKNISEIENYEKRLNNIKVQYGKLRNENEALREQIQIIRRNASGAHRELSSISNNLQKIQEKTAELKNHCEYNKKVVTKRKMRIEELNSSFNSEKQIIHEKLSKLEETYRKESYSVTPTAPKRPRTPYSELADNMKALKFINKKWSSKVKEKEKEIMYYKDNIKDLEEALTTMKNIISTKSINVAVKSFIDSCEQEKDLNSKFLRFSEKIEKIEIKIKKTDNFIKEVTETSKKKESERINNLVKIEKDLSSIQSEAKKLLEIKESQEKSIANKSNTILGLIHALDSLGIKLPSSSLIEDPSLNSTNIVSHLNKLEDLVEILVEGLNMNPIKGLDPKQDKNEVKVSINLDSIDDLFLDEIAYPMSIEELKLHAKNYLNSLT
jgi:DNA repair exonuclease SbcCD ATPase subunit